MRTYHKIPNVFFRSVKGNRELDLNTYSTPVIEYLADNTWEGTEKIDGTNVRIGWDGHTITLAGRTEKAQFPPMLENYLTETFLTEDTEGVFEQWFQDRPVTLYGEGYGQKIQEPYGSGYLDNRVSFRAFDLLFENTRVWAEQDHMAAFATALGIQTTPLIFTGTLQEARASLENGATTLVGEHSDYLEGYVLRPTRELRDRHGDRIICKMKTRDLKATA